MTRSSLPPVGSLVRGRFREHRCTRGVVVSHGERGECCVMLLGGAIETLPGWLLEVISRPEGEG